MWREPNSFAIAVFVGAVFARIAEATVCLPVNALPRIRHRVFAFVAAEGDPKKLVVAVGDRPLADIVSDRFRFDRVTVVAIINRVGRVEKNTGKAVSVCYRWRNDSRPVTAADAHSAKPIRESGKPRMNALASVR